MACASAVISAKRACASFAVHVFNGIAHILATTVPGELVNITPTSKAGNTVLREEYTSQCDVGLAIFELIGMSITRSEERRVGKECVSTCRSRWTPSH